MANKNKHTHASSKNQRKAVTETSIKGNYTKQGCDEHYDYALPTEEEATEEDVFETENELSLLEQIMVFGNILSEPRSRKKYGRR